MSEPVYIERTRILRMLQVELDELGRLAVGNHFTLADRARFARDRLRALAERIEAGEHLELLPPEPEER